MDNFWDTPVIPHPKYPPDLEFGIEVEVECKEPLYTKTSLFEYLEEGDLKIFDDDWSVTLDHSLKNNGAEFVLTKPKSEKDCVEPLNNLYDFLGDSLVDSLRAGVHIHKNVSSKTYKELMRFLLVCYMMEPFLVKMSGSGRTNNLFCLRLCDAPSPTKLLNVFANKQHGIGVFYSDKVRYAAINLKAISTHGSVEFRCFKTPSSAQEIPPWLSLINTAESFAESYKDLWKVFVLYTSNPLAVLKQIFPEETIPESIESDCIRTSRELAILFRTCKNEGILS